MSDLLQHGIAVLPVVHGSHIHSHGVLGLDTWSRSHCSAGTNTDGFPDCFDQHVDVQCDILDGQHGILDCHMGCSAAPWLTALCSGAD